MDTSHTVLYDGDEILYKACRVMEQTTTVCGFEQYIEKFDDIKRVIRQEAEKVVDICDADDMHFAFSDRGSNFRKAEYAPYKGNRKNATKPFGYWDMLDWMRSEWPSITWPHCEADDVMGVLGETYLIVASSDKDMLTVPGNYYDPYHSTWGKPSFRESSPKQADWYFMFQTLMGDPTDGFPGCPGVGKVKAERLLEPFTDGPRELSEDSLKDVWEMIEATYKLKKREPLPQARCARILRPGEAGPSFINLWEPPV